MDYVQTVTLKKNSICSHIDSFSLVESIVVLTAVICKYKYHSLAFTKACLSHPDACLYRLRFNKVF